jgi:hypothetical protein
MPAGPITPRLQLRRVFLRAAIVCLAVGGVVAAGALLLNQFNETTARILGTLVALAFHCGVAMFLLGRMSMGPSALYAQVTLVAFAAELLLLLYCIWIRPYYSGEEYFTLLFLCIAAVLARPGAALVERRIGPPGLGWATLAAVAGALVLSLITVWVRMPRGDMAQAAGTASIVAFTMSQFAWLVAAGAGTREGAARWLMVVCLIAAGFVAAGIIAMIWDSELAREELTVRILGAFGVVDGCSALVLVVMARLRGTPAAVGAVSAVRDVWLRCPRCATEQNVEIGAGACEACGLKIEVRVESTHCATCGYALANLPSRVCPECGTGF